MLAMMSRLGERIHDILGTDDDDDDDEGEEEEDMHVEDSGNELEDTDVVPVAGGPWSLEEDNRLRRLCATVSIHSYSSPPGLSFAETKYVVGQEGSGEWENKALHFRSSGRSANSIRQRWAKLQAEGMTDIIGPSTRPTSCGAVGSSSATV
jgi:hypothetical protein